MSSLSDQDHLNPNDQLYYAPRWLRERAEPLPASPAPPEKRSQSVARPNTPPHSFDALLEEAVAESLRHPLDPEVMHEPPGFVRELDRRMAILSVAGRFAAAIGVSAIVALFFVIMVPASRDYAKQPDGDASSVTGILQSVRTALSQPRQRDDELKPRSLRHRHPKLPRLPSLWRARSPNRRCCSHLCNGSKNLRRPRHPDPDHAIDSLGAGREA